MKAHHNFSMRNTVRHIRYINMQVPMLCLFESCTAKAGDLHLYEGFCEFECRFIRSHHKVKLIVSIFLELHVCHQRRLLLLVKDSKVCAHSTASNRKLLGMQQHASGYCLSNTQCELSVTVAEQHNEGSKKRRDGSRESSKCIG